MKGLVSIVVPAFNRGFMIRAALGYNRRLVGIKNLQLPAEEPWALNVYWMYGLVLSEETGMDALGFAQKLKQRGIETRPFFLGIT
jgi:perosamine synthetase